MAQTDVLPLFEGKAGRKFEMLVTLLLQKVTYTVNACAFFWPTSSSRSLISMTRLVQSLRASRLIRCNVMRLSSSGTGSLDLPKKRVHLFAALPGE